MSTTERTADDVEPITGRVLLYPRVAGRIAELNVTQAELAARVGCATTTIGAVYKGTVIPSADLRARFALALDTAEDELFALHPAVERLMTQAAEQGLTRGQTDRETLRRVVALATAKTDS